MLVYSWKCGSSIYGIMHCENIALAEYGGKCMNQCLSELGFSYCDVTLA